MVTVIVVTGKLFYIEAKILFSDFVYTVSFCILKVLVNSFLFTH